MLLKHVLHAKMTLKFGTEQNASILLNPFPSAPKLDIRQKESIPRCRQKKHRKQKQENWITGNFELPSRLSCFKGRSEKGKQSQQKDDFTRVNDIKKTCRGLPKRSEEFWFGLKCREGRRNSALCLHKLQSLEELWSRRADWLKENTQHRTFIDSWSFSATTRKDL